MHVEFMTNWNLFNQKRKLVLGGGSIEPLKFGNCVGKL